MELGADDAAHAGRPRLLGRDPECAQLRELLAAVRAGESRVLVLRGDAGMGKSALLDYAVSLATEMRILRAPGVESEMELPFAALHQLCAPVLDRLTELPVPQRAALETVFGLIEGAPPDRFLVGLAVLGLLSKVSEGPPLLCVVDDAQWLDRASAQVLGFVARRLLAESIVLVFGARQPVDELIGLSVLSISGLSDSDARALLDSVTHSPLDRLVRERILAETKGNPLGLLELPHGRTVTQLAGGFGLPRSDTVPGRIEQSFLTRIEALPADVRQLLLVAAADPVGDPVLVWRALGRLGVRAGAVAADDTDGLLSVEERVTFRHPLVRSAVYRAADEAARRAAHRALAESIDGGLDPDRRAWHLAAATVAPDESVAAELARSAGRAQARGGLAAAAAFLQRSVELTEELPLRVDRALAAAQVSLQAGAFDLATRMVAAAEAGATEDGQRARALLLHGRIAFASGQWAQASPVLLSAASKLEELDLSAARETYLDAWSAALVARESHADRLLTASEAALNLPRAEDPAPSALLLEGLATLTTSGRSAAAPLLRRATDAFGGVDAVDEIFRWGWLLTMPPSVLWDEESWDATVLRQVDVARGSGALARLPMDLYFWATLAAWRGDFAGAASAVAEAEAVVEATGMRFAPFGGMLLASLRGRETEAVTLFEAGADQGVATQWASWMSAVLFNGLGRHEQAFSAAQRASAQAPQFQVAAWALPELIEASARTDHSEAGGQALERLSEAASAADTDWVRGVEARSRALLSGADTAETSYQDAIDRLGRTQLRTELARARLVYGEWLRRQGRRVDARAQLRSAYDLFAAIGMEAFAERTRRELMATGETVRKRTAEASASAELTPQEQQIAMLVRNGMTNVEVGARLFLSPRTVEWHLRKIFGKLSITSRKQLRDALRDADWAPAAG